MIDATKLYFRYIRYSIAAQLQYRASFILLSFSHLLVTGIEFLGLWALFDRFGSLKGWELPEVALFYGTIQITFAFADALGRGFDLVARQIRNGSFDRLLLRPRSIVLQLFGYELTLRRIGRLIQGVVVLTYAFVELGLYTRLDAYILLCITMLCSLSLFLGLFIIQATISFWTIETLEVMNTLTYGGVATAQYPMTIYRTWFLRFFTYLVPLACVAYFPIATLLERGSASAVVGWLAPLAGPLFFAGSLVFWRIGLRHYASTGS